MNQISTREEQLFADAVAQPASQRALFVDSACGHDTALRARLNQLLAAHAASEGLTLDQPALGAVRDEQAGCMVGRYKLLQKLGVGGCGVVWMAEQEQPVRRRVALKVIKPGMDTREVIARFEAERQALALMDHPGIAKVLDAGATAAGRPYFVMELVHGVPITKYCDEQHLSIRGRLELFTRVCDAVQHAHQKGIIHRDLKPSNILVALHDSTPMPTVIDFGIAKATQGRLTDATLFTSFDQIIGTPAYMSPEQADTSGVDIDTRTDVYSLGVLLYELLAGRCPFDPKSLASPNRDEIRRLIREVDPPRPSNRVSTLSGADRVDVARRRGTDPGRLPVLLAGDLDWIVMRAMEKNRERRYDTPGALAEDIARHLGNEPVVARPPGGLYRARKFVRRHRAGMAAAAAVMVAMIAGTAISIGQAVRARSAEHAARAAWTRVSSERERADELLTFMFDELKAPLARIGDLNVLDRVIEKAMGYFASQDVSELDDRTAVKHVTALNLLGGLRMDQGRFDDAERAYREAHRRAVRVVERTPRNTAALWARSQAEWGNGFVMFRRGEIAAAREWFHRDGATRAALVSLAPNDVQWQRELAKQQHDLAALEKDHGDPERARQSFRDELATLEKIRATTPADLELQASIANVISFLGSLAQMMGDFTEARERFAQQTAHYEALARLDPRNTHWRFKQADSLLFLVDVSAISGERGGAARHLGRARELLGPLVARDPTNQRWQRASLVGELKQTQLLQAAGDTGQAIEVARRVREGFESVVTREPTDVQALYRLAQATRVEAEVRHAVDAADGAALAARALQLGDQLVARADATGAFRSERAAAGIIAGRIALARGDAAAAKTHWQRAESVLGTAAANTRDARVLDPALRLARLLDRADEATVLKTKLDVIGYVPFESWP